MQRLNTGWQYLRRLMKRAGPYVIIELLLPGGTLLALMLHLSRSGALNALQPMPVVCQQYFQCQVISERRGEPDPSAGVRIFGGEESPAGHR